MEKFDTELPPRLIQLLDNTLPVDDRIFALGALALNALRHGDISQAKQFAEQAQSPIAHVDTTAQYVLNGYAEVGTELWASGYRDRALAQRLTESACSALAQCAKFYPVGKPQLHRFHGKRL